MTVARPPVRRKVGVLVAVAFALGLICAMSVRAEQPVGRSKHGRPEVVDDRNHHGHYYPQRGAWVHTLPFGYGPYFYRDRPYYFNGGVWYRSGQRGFVVVDAAIGLNIPTLPPFYTTVLIAGSPYYYADQTYYQRVPGANGYAIVAPPSGALDPSPAPVTGSIAAPAQDGFYLYPKNGQSPEQQAADRFECHARSGSQTSFDPTQPGGGVSAAEYGPKSTQYTRAMTACLDARGYSVK